MSLTDHDRNLFLQYNKNVCNLLKYVIKLLADQQLLLTEIRDELKNIGKKH